MTEQNVCKVKICGLMREEDIYAVNKARPDFAGVILSEGFRRTIPAEQAGHFRDILSPEIPLAGVFVNDSPERIADLLKGGTIDIAQLHGIESEEEITFIKNMTGKPVWKVFRLKETRAAGGASQDASPRISPDEPPDMPSVASLNTSPDAPENKYLAGTIFEKINNSPADMVLLDAGTGTGEIFDWSICRNVRRPFILAGGLTPENVAEAILQTHPYAVDTSSGVETGGSKDADRISDFVKKARESTF